MPVFSRRQLRQTLGTTHVRDTHVGVTTMSVPVVPYAHAVVDQALADLSLSGQNMHVNSWLRVFGGDLRVGSFNVGSGALISNQYGAFVGAPSLGMPYELHGALSPTDKDRALDEAVKALRLRREVAVGINASQTFVPLPAGVERVLHGHLFASAGDLRDRDRHELVSVDVVTTPSGAEVRFGPAPTVGGQVALDAVTVATLGLGEEATVSAPDERLILEKAAAVCWAMLARRAPRGTADEYKRLQQEAEVRYEALARNFRVPDLRVQGAGLPRLGEDY